MAARDQSHVHLLVVILLLVLGIFLADIALRLRISGGIPYVAAVILTLWSPQRRLTLLVAAMSTILAILGSFLSPTGGEFREVLSIHVLAFFAIWVTALLVLQRKQSERALQESEARYRQLVELSPDAVVVHRDGVIVFANRAAAMLLGAMHPDDLVKQSLLEFVHPTYRELATTRLQRILQEGHVDLVEQQFVRLDGQVIDVEAAGIATVYQHAPAIQSVIRDITIRKRVEAALQESEERFRNLIEGSIQGVVIYRDFKPLFANQAYADILGYDTPENILAMDNLVLQVAAPHEHARLMGYVQARMRNEAAPTYHEFQGVRKDGSPVWLSNIVRVVSWEGAPAIQSTVFNITEHKRAEAALQKSEARLARILDSALDAIITIDADRCVVLFNLAAEQIFHCTAAEIQGQPFTRLCSAALIACIEAFIQRGEAQRSIWLPDGLTARRANDEEFPVEGTVSSVEGPDPTLYTVILRDINARKQSESTLQTLQLENVYLQEEIKSTYNFEEIVGASAALKSVLQAVEQVAQTDATVLLTGETGTGKELVARAIHDLSTRKDRPLIKVNCAALPSGLVESELFGHEKGAFTGAVARKDGRFALADKGTIFLDEVADIPPEVQIKLLRVLQEQEYERVGGVQSLKVDVRAIAATNRNLEHVMQVGQFRSDLYYRLHVFPIRLPPLRERRDDIPLLVKYFTMKYGKKLGKQLETIPPKTMAALRTYSWPGNVRELEHVIERALIVSQGPHLELGSWFPDMDHASSPLRTRTLGEMEREYILEVLEMTDWRVSGEGGAAMLLGMKRTTLESRMKKFGIRRKG